MNFLLIVYHDILHFVTCTLLTEFSFSPVTENKTVLSKKLSNNGTTLVKHGNFTSEVFDMKFYLSPECVAHLSIIAYIHFPKLVHMN